MLGETLALLAALAWSTSVVLFGVSKQHTPQGINLFKNAVAALLLLATMAAFGIPFEHARTPEDWALLAASGVVGIAVGDTLLFMALKRLGPGLLAIVECAYAPSMVAMSVVFLGESVGPWLLGGGALVLAGVLLAATDTIPSHRLVDPDHHVPAGAVLGVGAMLMMAVGIVFIKPIIEQDSLVEVSAVRLVAGIAGQLLWIALRPQQRGALRSLLPSRSWNTLLPASALSGYVAMLLWIGGFKWAAVSVASLLNQASSIFTIVLARIFVKDPITPRRASGAALAIAGVVWIVFSR